MTPNDLAAICRYMYGELWQSQISRFLGVSDRTVRRWVSGESAVPAGAAAEIIEAAAARQLDAAREIIEANRDKVPMIDLFVYTSGDVASPHRREWSAQADLAIKQAMAATLRREGWQVNVIER